MIAKCIIVLAVAAQIFASSCNQPTIALSSCGSSNGQSGFITSGSSSIASSAPITRNFVAKGKYPVALRNCGPTPDRQIPVTSSHSTAPVQEKPTVRLPCNIPAPKTISHTCTCYKTILRPRVHNHYITVPTVQRYIETLHKPVVENIQYEAEPVNCNDNTGVQMVDVSSGCSSSSVQTVQVPQVQTIQVPQVQTVQVPQVQTVQVPQVQTVQVPQVQTIQLPQVQTVQVPQVQTVQVPQVQTVQVPQVQTVEVPRTKSFEIPQSFSFGSSSCNTC